MPRPSPSVKCSWLFPSDVAVSLESGAVADGADADVEVLLVLEEVASSMVKFALRQRQASQSVLSASVIQRCKGSFCERPSKF